MRWAIPTTRGRAWEISVKGQSTVVEFSRGKVISDVEISVDPYKAK